MVALVVSVSLGDGGGGGIVDCFLVCTGGYHLRSGG